MNIDWNFTMSLLRIKVWFIETRPHFLILTLPCVFTGLSVAIYEGYSVNYSNLFLTLVGALLAHMSVNLFNDYHDFKSGIDKHTRRTPFNGGSGMLNAGYVKPENVLKFGLICFSGMIIIGAYFFMNFGPMILPIGLLGAVLICSYTQHLTKIALSEFSAGLGFGLIVIGTYFTQTGVYDSRIILVSLIPSLLIGNLLLLNEIPDIQPDALIGKRKNTPVTFGTKITSRIYSTIIVVVYILLFLFIIFQVLPIAALLSLAIAPLAVKAISGVLKNHMCKNIDLLLPSLRINVLVTILIPLLVSFSLIISKF